MPTITTVQCPLQMRGRRHPRTEQARSTPAAAGCRPAPPQPTHSSRHDRASWLGSGIHAGREDVVGVAVERLPGAVVHPCASGGQQDGPALRWSMARSMAWPTAGGSGMRTILSPFPHPKHRWPCSSPRSSMCCPWPRRSANPSSPSMVTSAKSHRFVDCYLSRGRDHSGNTQDYDVSYHDVKSASLRRLGSARAVRIRSARGLLGPSTAASLRDL
jgi:hypothetical protein